MSILKWFKRKPADDGGYTSSAFTSGTDFTRLVSFRLHHFEHELLAGTFAVRTQDGVSGFGGHQVVPDPGAAGSEIHLMHGMFIRHQMDPNGEISMSLDYYEIVPCSKSPLGCHQSHVLKTAICMGADSGEGAEDSIMIGEEHTLYFMTKKL